MHKLDYDRFIKDVQTNEKREEFLLFRDCKMFRTWNRAMIDKMVSICVRKSYEPDEYIIRQDAEPDFLYIILDGLVHIIKEITITNRNKWPVSLTEWRESAKSTVTSMTMTEMSKGEYFGELAILKHTKRAASAVARTRVTCVCIGKNIL
jgi:CRP-like cAMP-binding protein